MTTQFENIFHGLDSAVGKLRMSQGGLGWKALQGDGPTITIAADQMKSFQWTRVARNYQLRISLKNEAQNGDRQRETFDGFTREDFDKMQGLVQEYYGMTLEHKEISTRGWNWGKAQIQSQDVQFLVRDKLAFEVPLAHVANSNIAGRTEVSLEFINPEQQQPVQNTGASTNGAMSKAKKSRKDQLVEMRFYVPGTVERGSEDGSAPEGEEEESAAQAFHEMIKNKADIGTVAGDGIILFKEVLVLTPRGRYDIDMFSNFLRLRGKTYDYKILYSSISRLFLLPKPDEIHVQFVIGLDPPIRQGQTRYPYLVLQFPREEEMDAELNVDEDTIQTKYEGKLKKRYEEPTFRIVTNLFKVLSGQKLSVPGHFESSGGQASIKCNVKATDGLLYPLDKALIWVSKQPVYVPYSDVHQIVFSRVGGAVSSSKTFDLRVVTKNGPEHSFQSLNREEHDKLNMHFGERKLRVKNEMNDAELAGAGAAAAALLSDDEEEEEEEEEEEDEEMMDGDQSRKTTTTRKKKKSSGKAGRGDAGGAMEVEDSDSDSEDDEDFQAESSDDGGSPSEASSDEEGGGVGGGGDAEMSDGSGGGGGERPRKKKRT